MSDARFAEGAEAGPLRLIARDAQDLAVLSALVQDAALTQDKLVYAAKRRRFALGLNRFRWEDAPQAGASGRGYERVQALLVIEDVLAVQTAGLAPGAALSLLSLSFAPAPEAPGGWLHLHLSGGAGLRLQVEALEVSLRDVSRPYLAPSGRMPDHGAD